MLAKHSSGSADGVAGLYGVAKNDGSIANKNAMPAHRVDVADDKPVPAGSVGAADCQKTGFWSSVFNFLMEGFALGGASLHPTTFFPVELYQDEQKVPMPRDTAARKWREPMYLISSTANRSMPSSGSHRRNDHSRHDRERAIEEAVAALARLDDRTLRELGIPDRSCIDQTVRYCHDC